MFTKIDIKTAKSLAKSMMFLLLSYVVTLIGVTATLIALGSMISQIHAEPYVSSVTAFCLGFVISATNSFGIYFFLRSEASL